MRPLRSVALSPVLKDAILVVGLVTAVCLPVWPGLFTVDSQAIQRAVIYGDISDWYAPLHLWGWALVDRAFPAGVVFVLGVGMFVASLLALTRQLLPAGAARVAAAVTVLFPPVYGLLGWVGRDVWFTTAALAVSGTALRVHREGRDAPRWLLVALVVSGAAAADARQNGLPFAILAVSVVAIVIMRRWRPRAVFLVRVGGVTVSLAVFCGAFVLAQRAVMTRDLKPEQVLFASDLAAVSLQTGRPVLGASLFPAQDVEVLRERLAGHAPDAVVSVQPPIVRFDDQASAINRLWIEEWRDMVLSEPGPYLTWRLRLYLRQLGITVPARSPYFVGSDMLSDGIGAEVASQFPEALDARNRVLSWTQGPSKRGLPLYAPLFYVVAAFLSTSILGRKTGERRAAVAFALVLATMQGLLFFTAPAHEFRFHYFQVVFGTSLCATVLLLQLQSRRRTAADRSSVAQDEALAWRPGEQVPPDHDVVAARKNVAP